jgi:hypothetical protein
MSLLDKSLRAGAVVVGIVQVAMAAKESLETRRRRSTTPSFDDGVSRVDFRELLKATAARTPRVTDVDVIAMTGVIRVQSSSGLTSWKAEVDFNDYGHLTGRYWLKSDNPDSAIPDHYARAVQAEIKKRVARIHADGR